MVFHIGYQIRQALPLIIAGAAVMHVAKGALDGIDAGAIGRQKQQRHAWVIAFALWILLECCDLPC